MTSSVGQPRVGRPQHPGPRGAARRLRRARVAGDPRRHGVGRPRPDGRPARRPSGCCSRGPSREHFDYLVQADMEVPPGRLRRRPAANLAERGRLPDRLALREAYLRACGWSSTCCSSTAAGTVLQSEPPAARASCCRRRPRDVQTAADHRAADASSSPVAVRSGALLLPAGPDAQLARRGGRAGRRRDRPVGVPVRRRARRVSASCRAGSIDLLDATGFTIASTDRARPAARARATPPALARRAVETARRSSGPGPARDAQMVLALAPDGARPLGRAHPAGRVGGARALARRRGSPCSGSAPRCSASASCSPGAPPAASATRSRCSPTRPSGSPTAI